MEWKKLLTTQRLQDKKKAETSWNPEEFEQEYMSIISSSYFRRLQGKTQVFTLDENDFVRNRLTHSFEVSTIAGIIGRRVADM